jgi:hypothetical protein
MSLPDVSGPVDGPDEVPRTGDDQPGAKGQGELEQARAAEVQIRRLELAAVERDFDSRLREQISRSDATIEAVEELGGRVRSESLARIREDINHLDDLLAEHDREASRAGAQLLGSDAAGWIEHYRAEVKGKIGDLRRLEGELQREQHIEESHIRRVPGLAGLDLSGVSRTIVTQVARMTAKVLANHIVPRNGDRLVQGREMIMRACDAPEKLDHAEDLKIGVPLSIGSSLIGLNIGTMLSDDDAAADEPSLAAGHDVTVSGQPASWPSVELVEEGVAYQHADEPSEPEEPGIAEHAEEPSEPDDSSESADGSGAAARADAGQLSVTGPSEGGPPGERADQDPAEIARLTHWRWWAPDAASPQSEPETEAPLAAGQGPAGETPGPDAQRRGAPPAAGVVIWGSAKVIAGAARMRILSSDVLLSFARREAFRKIYDGTPESVMAAMDAACGIEVVVLLDPDIQGGLWVDVDPVTQVPAATMLIEMPISADGSVADLRLFRYEA